MKTAGYILGFCGLISAMVLLFLGRDNSPDWLFVTFLCCMSLGSLALSISWFKRLRKKEIQLRPKQAAIAVPLYFLVFLAVFQIATWLRTESDRTLADNIITCAVIAVVIAIWQTAHRRIV